jgi:nucleoside-diphosphate-sugar epimerase
VTTFLVTGATGFVGGHLARRLVADGERVVALVRDPSSPRLPAGVEALPIPADTAAFVAAVRQAHPDICIHLATHFVAQHTMDDIGPLVDANLGFGTRLAEALVALGSPPLIDAGTVWQHLGGERFRPANLYAATKQAFADILTAYPLPVGRLTLTDTYGPDDPRPKLVPALVHAARTGEPLAMGSGQQLVDLVHVDDVVDAFLQLAADFRPETFVVTSGQPVTVRELVGFAEKAAGRPLPVQWGARPERSVDAVAPRSPDPTLPGWRPRVDLVTGLRPLLEG